MSITLNGTTGITSPAITSDVTGSINGLTPQASNMQPFNRIINGSMTVDQRNAGAAVTANDGTYPVDRFRFTMSASGKGTSQQQSSIVPVGFSSALRFTSSAATTLGATDFYCLEQYIESNNLADMAFGTVDAKTFTISFKVYSSLTGTFSGSVQNGDSTRSYPFTYTISSANTWALISVTIAGDQSGTWLPTTNGTGMKVCFSLGVGSSRSGTAGAWTGGWYPAATGATSVVGTSGATFYITGVQLEAGSSGSSFAHENYSDTLRKCQRYYQRIQSASDTYKHFGLHFCATDSGATAYGTAAIPLVTTMRAIPTLVTTGTVSNYSVIAKNTNFTCTNISIDTGIDDGTISGNLYINAYTSTGNTAGAAGALRANNTASAFIAMDAEL